MVNKERWLITIPISRLQVYVFLAIITAVGIGAVSFYSLSRFRTKSASNTSATLMNSPAITAVAALGRLEPQGEVINLSAPNSQAGVQLARLLVDEGDRVVKGQVIALVDSFYVRLAALEQAQKLTSCTNRSNP